MNKRKLLVTDKIDLEALSPLKRYFDITVKIGLAPQELGNIIDSYDCLITRSATSIPDKLISKFAQKTNGDYLKIIARAGIGVDNIDIFASTRHKIAVINAPKGNAGATSEHTIGLIFALLRYIPQANRDLIKGLWNKSKYVGTQIKGKTLGIVGFGNVGKEVYRLAKGIGMQVIVCEPYIRLPQNIAHVTYEELLKESDIISFHVPSTYLTRNMFNKNTLALCKDEIFLINCSRGQILDDKAVFDGLKNGKIKGFALDVFTKEPPVNLKLLNLPNVIATPHIAGSTIESQQQSVQEVVTAILSLIRGIAPFNLLNPQVFAKEKKPVKKTLEFDAVIFDCDSTLTKIEGIDELAGMYGKKKEIARLTKLAMEGKANFEDIFQQRLELLRPSRQNLERLGNIYIRNLTEDAITTIAALNYLRKKVYIISSGLAPALFKLADHLQIPSKNIFANDLMFDKNGNFLNYIKGPLIRNHGKLQIIRQIRGRKIMFGDGITDLETKQIIDLFVGFGGIKIRPIVEEESDIFIYSKSLSVALVLSIGSQGAARLLQTKFRKLVGKGLDLLSHKKHTKIIRGKQQTLHHFKHLAYL